MLNMFLDAMMADPPPQCFVWLPLMHRLANVENGESPVRSLGSVPLWSPPVLRGECPDAFLTLGSPCGPVFHPVECSYCRSESMMGFRYRCQQCHNYQLCQNCFWRGHASGSHSNQHQMKEHSSWVGAIPWDRPLLHRAPHRGCSIT